MTNLVTGFDYRAQSEFRTPSREFRRLERSLLSSGCCRRPLGVPEGDYLIKDRTGKILLEVWGAAPGSPGCPID